MGIQEEKKWYLGPGNEDGTKDQEFRIEELGARTLLNSPSIPLRQSHTVSKSCLPFTHITSGDLFFLPEKKGKKTEDELSFP